MPAIRLSAWQATGRGAAGGRPWRGNRTIRRRSIWYSQRGSADHTTITVTFGLAAIIFVGLLGLFYLQQVVNTASQGTDVRDLETAVVELREKQRQLELEGAELRSLQVVEDRVKQLNLVATDKVTYLAPVQDRVAAHLE
jgi:hypothetical protein